jgi:hypothetical protein
VLADLFDRCQNGTNNFIIVASSSYSKARVWTMHTMRAVDLEQNGAPTEEQQRSRVSYMSVPYFLSVSSFTGYTTVQEACEQVVGLQIVGVEYLNEQNVLVTVLAAQPRHYNAREGRMEAGRPRTHRYYYLHPGRHDCVQTDAEDVLEDNPSIFSCWRPQSSGMWPTDDAISLHSGGGCTRELLVPAFGLAVVMPFVAVVRMLETTLDAVCTLTAVMATHSHNPFQTLQELFTVATYCVMRGTCSNRGHSPTCIHAPVNMVTHYVPASRWGNPSLPSITTVPWPCHAALLLPSQPCTPRQQRYVLECLHSVHGIASVRVENHTVNKLRSSWSGSLPGSGEQQHHHVAR